MKKTVLQNLSILALCLLAHVVFAQPTNDECVGALRISDPSSCGNYSLVGATPSGLSAASCGNSVNGDIWFSFIPQATSITVTVNGQSSSNPSGTLRAPIVAIYRGDCNSLNELRCGTDNNSSNFAEITLDGVFVGVEYLIRVDSRSATSLGSFELCLNNFNQPAEAGGDCATRALLCDKSSFTVESVTGAGNDTGEMDGTTCFVGAGTNLETNSTWFTWTADNDGSLEFSLTPLNITDDLDFVLYLLPNGVNDCSGKQQIRCMASGEGTFNTDGRCSGATGLRSSSTDGQELSGCEQASDDNFLAAVDMIAGQSFALVVNNFSGGGNGFEMEFGGTGNFRGPDPEFTMTPMSSDACLGNQITFLDASTYADGNIASWAWTFGIGGDIETATGQGPHRVTYNTPGIKQIVLTLETDQGCIITEVQDIVIDPCCQTQNAISQTANITDSNCADTNQGSISLAVNSNYGPHQFLWDNGSSSPIRNNLNAGDYTVTVTGTYCDTIFTYPVDSESDISSDTLIGMPTCDGGTDGSITLTPMGGVEPYEYLWNNAGGYINDNFLNGLSVSSNTVIIRDAIGCDDTLDIQVNELQLLLVPGDQNVTMPTCFEFADGRIVLNIDNGQGPYTYNFNNQGFDTQNERNDLTAGIYNVEVLDANRCRGAFTFEITDHPELTVAIDKMDISCNGEVDGSAMATLSGGVDGYTYSWNNGMTNPEITNLPSGTYTITGRDANGCEVRDNINIVEPGAIGLTIDQVTDVICNGDETGSISISPIGGSGSFTYSLDGTNFSSETLFDALPAGDYTITIRDANDCTNTNMATIVEPPPLVVDAGMDQEINFAFETTISTTYGPPSRIVSYAWSPDNETSCTDCASIRVGPFRTTDYVVRIEDQTMCVAFDTVRIVVNDIRPIFVPNVFSPNSDGTNDRLGVYSNIAAVNVDLFQIYDRWGGLIFESENLPLNDPTMGWDGTFKGKSLNAGVYIYQAKIRFLDNEVRDYSGDVTLLR